MARPRPWRGPLWEVFSRLHSPLYTNCVQEKSGIFCEEKTYDIISLCVPHLKVFPPKSLEGSRPRRTIQLKKTVKINQMKGECFGRAQVVC